MESRSWRLSAGVKIFVVLLFMGTGSIQKVRGQQADSDTVSVRESARSVRDAFHDKEELHSPHKATFYSAILPGLGQAYNKKYWKIPILYGGIGAMGYAIHFNSTNYNKYKNAYRDFLIRDPGNKSYEEVIPPTLSVEEVETQHADWFQRALENKREYYKRYRDLSYIGMAAIYILNMIDATVDAHFYNFDVSDDLSMDVRPVMLDHDPVKGNKMGIRMSFNF
ncbi:MAG: DUF5683 domain-containing protein [Marinilabilia sp.]